MLRVWTDVETEAFVTFLEEAVVAVHRTDNGQFKPGTFQLLARLMVEKFPGCAIEKTHMQNKHKRLQEKYQTAYDMLNCSGFGWNESKQCVEVDSKQVLDEWMRKHPNRFYTPGKPFSLYPRLEFIFWKDRATGAAAQDGNDAAAQFEADENEANTAIASLDHASPLTEPGLPDTPGPTATVHIAGSVASSSNTDGNQLSKGKRKMRNSEVLENIAVTLARATECSLKSAQIIADAMDRRGQQIPQLGDELGSLGFSTEDVVTITLIFSQNPHAGNLFWTLNAEQKQAYVQRLLRGDV